MTSGQDSWDPAILKYAVAELLREFPNIGPERIITAVGRAAQAIPPAEGHVALLRKSRERLRE